jgi:hypothetical protein
LINEPKSFKFGFDKEKPVLRILREIKLDHKMSNWAPYLWIVGDYFRDEGRFQDDLQEFRLQAAVRISSYRTFDFSAFKDTSIKLNACFKVCSSLFEKKLVNMGEIGHQL